MAADVFASGTAIRFSSLVELNVSVFVRLISRGRGARRRCLINSIDYTSVS